MVWSGSVLHCDGCDTDFLWLLIGQYFLPIWYDLYTICTSAISSYDKCFHLDHCNFISGAQDADELAAVDLDTVWGHQERGASG